MDQGIHTTTDDIPIGEPHRQCLSDRAHAHHHHLQDRRIALRYRFPQHAYQATDQSSLPQESRRALRIYQLIPKLSSQIPDAHGIQDATVFPRK